MKNKGKLIAIIFGMALYVVGLILVILGFTNILDSTFWGWFPLIWWFVVGTSEVLLHSAFIDKLEAEDKDYNQNKAQSYVTGDVYIDSDGKIHDHRESKKIERDNAGWMTLLLAVVSPVVFPVDSIIQLVKCI